MIQIKKAGVVIKVSIFMGSKYVSDTVLQIKNTNNLKFCIDSFNSSLSLSSHTICAGGRMDETVQMEA